VTELAEALAPVALGDRCADEDLAAEGVQRAEHLVHADRAEAKLGPVLARGIADLGLGAVGARGLGRVREPVEDAAAERRGAPAEVGRDEVVCIHATGEVGLRILTDRGVIGRELVGGRVVGARASERNDQGKSERESRELHIDGSGREHHPCHSASKGRRTGSGLGSPGSSRPGSSLSTFTQSSVSSSMPRIQFTIVGTLPVVSV
jgi:hypothetical protein